MATKKAGRKAEDICIRVGRTVKALRIERGWKQADLSAYTGIDRAFLSKIETGASEPCLRSLETLAKALGIPLAELIAKSTG